MELRLRARVRSPERPAAPEERESAVGSAESAGEVAFCMLEDLRGLDP